MLSSSQRLLLCCLVGCHAVVDKTGRRSHGHPTSRVGEGVRTVTVQMGNKKDRSQNDVHVRWEKDFNLGRLRTHLTAKTSWPKANFEEMNSHVGFNGVLDSLYLSGSAMDVVYDLHHHDATTDVDLAYDVPGVRLMSSLTINDDLSTEVSSVGAFQTLGAFCNLQPTWLPGANRLRLKLGQGIRRGLCPVSVTADFAPGDLAAPKSYTVGMRQELSPGRMLRAKVLLPPEPEERSVWAELRDHVIDKEALWIAKASMPLAKVGDARNVEITLRRAWQF